MPTPRIPPRDKPTELRFPYHGIDLSQGYNFQAPGTTPTGTNVRAYEAGTARQRGGQRPGLSRYAPYPVPAGGLIQELAVVVGVGYSAPAPSSGPYILQNGGGSSGTGTTTVETLPSPATTGGAILVVCGSRDGARAFPTSITDGAGNTYTRLSTSSVSSIACSTWLATNVTGGFTSITVTWGTGSGTVQSYSLELGGVPTSSAADSSSSPTGKNTFGSGTNLTTTHTPDILFGCIQGDDSVTRSGGAYADLKTGGTLLVCYKNLASIQTTGADLTFGFNSNVFWAGVMQSIKGS